MKVKLADQVVQIKAPREMVFQMLSAIGKGSLPGAPGEHARVLQRDGDTLIAEFFTPSGKRIYRTVEEVRLYPPERITFRHLEGPLNYSQEAFTLTEVEEWHRSGLRRRDRMSRALPPRHRLAYCPSLREAQVQLCDTRAHGSS